MHDKLNRFISNLNGQFVEVSYHPAIYQCMDLAYAWIFALDIPKATIQHGAAWEVWDKASDLTREYFELIPNTPDFVPEDGDLAVWGKSYGKYGHIGIALSGGTTNRFKVFEQNNPVGTSAHIQERGYNSVVGFLRPKQTPKSATITDQTRLEIGERGGIDFGIMEFQAIKSTLFDLTNQLSGKNDKIKELTSEVETNLKTINDLTNKYDGLPTKVERLEGEKLDLKEELAEVRSDLAKTNFRANALSTQVENLEKELDKHKENNDIMAYGFFTRLFSLFKRG